MSKSVSPAIPLQTKIIYVINRCWPKGIMTFQSLFLCLCSRLTCPGDLWGCHPSKTRRRWAVRTVGFLPLWQHFKMTAVSYDAKKLWWRITQAVMRITRMAVGVYAPSSTLQMCYLLVLMMQNVEDSSFRFRSKILCSPLCIFFCILIWSNWFVSVIISVRMNLIT